MIAHSNEGPQKEIWTPHIDDLKGKLRNTCQVAIDELWRRFDKSGSQDILALAKDFEDMLEGLNLLVDDVGWFKIQGGPEIVQERLQAFRNLLGYFFTVPRFRPITFLVYEIDYQLYEIDYQKAQFPKEVKAKRNSEHRGQLQIA